MALFKKWLADHLDAQLKFSNYDNRVVMCPENKAEEVAKFAEEA